MQVKKLNTINKKLDVVYHKSVAVLISGLFAVTTVQADGEIMLAALSSPKKSSASYEELTKSFYAQFRAPLTNTVYLYYENRFLETIQLTTSENQLKLAANDAVINNLPVLAEVKKAIVLSLKQPLVLSSSANSSEQYYCILYCEQALSQQVALSYRPHKLDAKLILPSSMVKAYYQDQQQYEKTEFSFEPNSALMNLDVGMRGLSQHGQNSQDQYLNYLFNGLYQRYSLTNSRNSAGKKELFSSYAREDGSLLSVGRINAQLAIPFSQEFYGLELSSENLRYPVQKSQEFIYEDYFATNSQLHVYIDDKLVMQQNIAQGYQQIAAGTLPAGDYDARLVFTDIHGQTREVIQRIHRSAFPTLFRRAPQWQIQFGQLNTPPEVKNRDFASLMYGRQFTNKLAGRIQVSAYDGTFLAKTQALYEHNRWLSDWSVSTVNNDFYRAVLSETIRRDWGGIKYQWDYAKNNQQNLFINQDNSLNLSQQLSDVQSNNTHYLTADYKLQNDWWLGAGASLAKQQEQDFVNWYVHSSKYLKTGFFSRPTQFFIEFNHRKPTSNTIKQSQNVFRLSVSQSFDVAKHSNLYGRMTTKQFVDEGEDSFDTGLTLTSRAIKNLEQSYSVNNQWQNQQHSFNINQRYKHDYAELTGQYQADQSCEDCVKTHRYGASLRTNLTYSQGDMTAFRNQRGSSGVMIDNQSDADLKLDVSGSELTVPAKSVRAVSVQPYVNQALRYKVLTEVSNYDYLLQPSNNNIKIRPNEVAKFTFVQRKQQYLGVRLLDKQKQALTMQKLAIKQLNKELMTDAQGGVIIPIASEQLSKNLKIELIDELNDHSTSEACQIDIPIPTSLTTTYSYLGEIECE